MNRAQAAGYMARALVLAARGRYDTFPNPRVGCVIVRNDRVVGEGWHERAGQAHAEVHALRQAGDHACDAEVFVSLEPCSHHGRTPPCAEALKAAGVRRVWVAMQDPNPQVAGRGVAGLRDAGIEVELGLLELSARQLNRGFISRMNRRRPFVVLKLGASLDGRTAMASGESQWITSAPARADVHRLRAEAGAVMTGSATVLADNPQLNVRQPDLGARIPDRIVLDSSGRIPSEARVWADDGARRFWFHGPEVKKTQHLDSGVQAFAVERSPAGRLDLATVLARLADLEVNEVLAECGPTLAGALLQAGLVDELITYLAPRLLGDDGRGLAAMPGLQRLDQSIRLRFIDVRNIGADLRITAIPESPEH